MAKGRSPRPRQLPTRMLLAQQGINLIERVVLQMKCRWHATAAIDVGIDGTIELSDQGEEPRPLGLVLHVQSRATDLPRWPHEDANGFVYVPREEDLSYWLQGNAPVLLIVSRPATNEAYWVSIKDYFRDPTRRSSRRIEFDKARDAFTGAAYARLFEVAREQGRVETGLYLAPPRVQETLVSNLLPVAHFGPRLFVAETRLRTREQVFAALREAGAEASGLGVFIPVGKALISPYDLREEPWPKVCERGTVDEFDVSEWALSDDPDRQREYARLLRLALTDMFYPVVRMWPEKDVFAFATFGEQRPRRFEFFIRGRRRRPSVVRVYERTFNEKEFVRYRHLAMQAAFRRSGDRWFLEITPTYLFTRDGRQVDPRHENLLSGIKRLEHQPAVLAHLELWEAFLRRPAGLFHGAYPYLSFAELMRLSANFGIVDAAWQQFDVAASEMDQASDELVPETLWS